MQLCCVIDGNKYSVSHAIKGLIVFLMVFLFAGAPVIDALHAHEHPCQTAILDGHSVAEAQVKCKICDHFAHHQPAVSMLVASVQLLRAEGKVTTLQTYYSDKLLGLSGLGWTNKGPPILV
jgi:hypothetical protein